ncbi:shikimate dehydrogenase [Corynebacterium uropygiale]|uniref:shikimate dehydrogenase (NADP(+)) n=1 Tax=Corynebacterium uropygiale TaxID=1775911 RepID=A0A9X1QNC5_9CORY|nr:shikimate dehydrogenase [Corynebacterium uropygiale]MCF4006552.1 shikimate dehydrogenase [Corynebacterium uropygiale]
MSGKPTGSSENSEPPEIAHRAAVLGSPIEHSLSPILHEAGYAALGLEDWEYTRIECTGEQLPGLVGSIDDSYRGFSVTMPGKFAALNFATEVSDRARAIGSANTLVRTDDGWRADNTDCDGVAGALDELLGEGRMVEHCLVIGGGGTARPALWTLAQRGASRISVINRSDRRAELEPLATSHGASFELIGFEEDLQDLAAEVDVIVSTVPSRSLQGREPELAHAPVLDVIYDPWPTPLVAQAAANGYRTVGGHVMLAYQSFGQFEQFTGHAAPREAMREALERHIRR